MNMPGFNAEASLHNSGKHYQNRTYIFNNQHVIPQVSDLCLRKGARAFWRCRSVGYDFETCMDFEVDTWEWCERVYG